MAAALGKPLILEEFGLARDGEGFLPAAAAGAAAATDGHRREFYAALLALVLASHRAGDGGGDGGDGGGDAPAAEISGVSFWAWAGARGGRAHRAASGSLAMPCWATRRTSGRAGTRL